jgi:hypothetical protein
MSSLFGDETVETPPRKRATRKPPKDEGLQRVLEHYYKRFEERFGFPAVAMWARDKKMLRPFVEAWGADEMVLAVNAFLDTRTTDPRIVAGFNPDFSVQHLVRVVTYLRVSEAEPPRDHKTSQNADAIARATGMHRTSQTKALGGRKK